MDNRGRCWSITINNPDELDDHQIQNLPKGWFVMGQLEEGEEGTRHYQIMLKTPTATFNQIKQHFGRAHIELARDPKALAKYVTKTDTRVDSLPPKLKRETFMELVINKALDIMKQRKNRIIPSLDLIAGELIMEGHEIEYLACAPVNRLVWRKYCDSIIQRHMNKKYLAQEDITDGLDTRSREGSRILEGQHDDGQEQVEVPVEQDTVEESDEGTEDGSEASSEDSGGDEVCSVSDDDESDCST